MYEDVIYNILLNSDIVNYVSKLNNEPAIFSEYAPDTAEFPYLVFRIITNATDCLIINESVLMFDYFTYNDYYKAREVQEKIECLFDRALINESDKCSAIRPFFFSSSFVTEDDPRITHLNIQFSCRMSRKNYLLTL